MEGRANSTDRETAHDAGISHNSDDGRSEVSDVDDTPADSDESGGFLESFASASPSPTASSTLKSNEALEESFHEMLAAMEQRAELESQASDALAAHDMARMTQLRSEGQALVGRLNSELGRLEGDLKRARELRPNDPLVQWLTGELLMQVGGEPYEMLPYFEKAVDGGLERTRLFASLARVQLEANQFAAAYDSSLKSLETGKPDRYAWETYDRVALGNEHFDEVIERLDAAFPIAPERPAWEVALRERAIQLIELWQRELAFREADRRRDDLPRVRLTIEHRRFAADGAGNSTSQIETTGRGEVELELFEEQAPQTVANFIELVEEGFYDGTLFIVAESARYVRAGDPNSRNDDPSDDGIGGPGYVIPDEFEQPDARGHFRGSLSMVNTGPHTAGSQFFITLTPNEMFNHHFTVFGRVIDGQEVVDRITLGRTTRDLGQFGKLIPGDVLVKAEVIRKRAHAYVATKE